MYFQIPVYYIFFIEIAKRMVQQSFSSKSQEISKLQPYEIETAEKSMLRVTIWEKPIGT